MTGASHKTSVNAEMSMSPESKARMRRTEKDEYRYYNDMGRLGGNCTWGAGTMAHKGPCTEEELKTPVSAAAIEAAFARKVGEAERAVRRNVDKQVLTQAQFDALVSLSYNAGPTGSKGTYAFVNSGDFASAAANISSMTLVTVQTKAGSTKVVARGLIKRRAEESAPFRVPQH